MKKVLTITAFILLAVVIWMRFYAPINRMALILRHISLFLLIGIGAYTVLTTIYKWFMSKYKPTGFKETILSIGRVFSFGLIMILFGSLQINYVDFSETPMLEGCKYYDRYNNLVYQSLFYTSCPELTIITNSEETLEFEVQEYTDVRQAASLGVIDRDLEKNETLELYTLTTIKIVYNDDSNIASIDQKVTYIASIKGSSVEVIYNSYHKNIVNSYTDGYSSTIKEAEMKNYNADDAVELIHYDFDESDFTLTTLYLVDGYEQVDGKITIVAYEFFKDYTNDIGEVASTKIANMFCITEDNRITYTVLPNDLSYPNLFHQIDNNRRIDVVYTENEITWSIESSNETADYHTQRFYNRNLDNRLTKTVFGFEAPFLSDPTYEKTLEYRSLIQDEKEYVYSQNISSAVQFRGDYNDRLSSIVVTEYGMQIKKLTYRTQSYISYLFNGDLSYGHLYYELTEYSGGFNYYKLFDIEQNLIELQDSNSLFYTKPVYFIYE